MPHGVLPPEYYLEPVQFPHPPLCTSDYLDEQHAVRAITLYPSAVSNMPKSEVLRRKFVRLLQVRYGEVDPSWLDMITGTISDADKAESFEEVQKWTKADQNRWIGPSSWIQKWIAGEIACHNQKVVFAMYNQNIMLLKKTPLYDTAAETDARLKMCDEYEQALREYTEHIHGGIDDCLEGLENEIVQKTLWHSQDPKLVALRKQSDTIKRYLNSLTPAADATVRRGQNIELESLFYSQMDSHARTIFWRSRWSIDVMASWLWQFSSVLHFKANWDDTVNQMMFRDRFVYLADLVYQHILAPQDPYVSPRDLESSTIDRNVMKLSHAKAIMNAGFTAANDVLWPIDCDNPPGDHLSLFVEATAHNSSRKGKRMFSLHKEKATAKAIARKR